MTEIQLLKQDMDISRVMMVITILIAVTSIVFSSITMAFERSYDRKSLRPFFNMEQVISNNLISLSITNAGLGPMSIIKLVLIDQSNSKEITPSVLPELLPAGLKYESLFKPSGNFILASGKQLILFLYNEPASSRESKIPLLKEKLEQYSLYIEYQDVYERRYKRSVNIKF